MKKSFIALLILGLLACSLFVSCNSDVSAPEALTEELVSVTFDDGAGSKSLTAILESFNKDAYYWKYAAKKADDSGLTSGATETYDEAGALPVSNGNPGLGSGTTPYKVSGFSQGLWDFTLFAYRTKNTDTGAYEDLIYSGEAKNVSLTKGGSNIAYVVVNPVSTGNGIIKIGAISFVPKKAGDETSHTKVIEVTNPDGSAVSGITYDSSNQEYTVPAGAYKVTVKFTNSASTIVYAEGYVIATVYPGLKTTVAGDLNELVTYAQFDAELNPDAVNAQAVSNAVTYDAGTQAQDVDLASSSSSEKTVTTTVKRADVNSIIEAMAAEQAVPTDASTTSLKLALNVDPTEATQTTVTYEIGMTATLTYQETAQSEAQVSEKSVIDLNNYIVVEIEMSTGLTQVNVTHSGLNMIKCASKAELDAKTGSDDTNLAGYFYYDPAGTLYLKTKKFSPFAISYTAPTNYVASVDSVKYSTLEAAIDKADSTKKVTLLTDVALTSTVNTSKTFEIDLNGYSITAENFRAIWVKEGTLTLSGSGTIAANKVGTSDFSASSSVIRVGDTEGSSVGLVIGANVTISSSHCYGVTIFGTEATEQSLVVDGKIKVTGTASAISGNGTSSWKPTDVTINDGAEISAENDYAIYQPQSGTLTINGGAISGKGGIEAKAGRVTVNGGVITATAPETTHNPYGNGPSTSGYALVAVENNGYKGSVDITVNGGSFNGEVGIVVDEGCEFTDPTKKPKMNVVAQVNDKLFTTLQSAIDNAANGDTVYLIQDVTCGLVTIDGKQLTVEGNNYTINSTPERTDGEGRAMNIWGDGVDVSLRNLKINAPAGDNRGVNIGDIATVSMNNCTVVCEQYYAVNIVSQGSNTDPSCVTLSINNCELRGWAAINHHGSNSLITIEGSTLVGINNNSGATNAFATIVVDGNSLFNPGSTVSGNTITIKDSTIIAEQRGDQVQDWISYQYGANNNTSTVSVSGTLILDKENGGEDKSYSMNISGMGNTVVLPLSDASKAKINPKAFVVTETTTEGVYEVTNRIDVLYYWKTTSGYAGGYHDIYSPFEKGRLADGEYIALVTDVSLLDDITCSLTSGSFYLLVGDHSFNGGYNHSINLNAGVYILSDSANIGSLLKCGDKEVICDTEGDYFRYHFESDGEIAKQMAIEAGADPDKVVVYDDYAIATMNDDVEYVFYPDETISVYDTANYNGYDGTSTVDSTKYTVGKLVKGVTDLGGGCFSNNTTITHVAFAKDIVSAYKSFQNNSTIKVVDLTNLTSIPNRMFYGMSGVETFIVPDSVKRIDDWAFYANTGMKTIIVGQNVEYIGYKAFDGCSSLETVDILGSPEIVNWAGRGCTALKDLYLRGENTSYNMTYAPEGNNVGGFVIAKGQSGNPDTFGYTVHVYSKEVYNAFKLYNNQNNSTPTMEIINDIN